MYVDINSRRIILDKIVLTKDAGDIFSGFGPDESPRLSANMNIDDDGDGFTENQGDCNDGDADIHPNAIEVCGDGIDNGCSGGDATCSGGGGGTLSCPECDLCNGQDPCDLPKNTVITVTSGKSPTWKLDFGVGRGDDSPVILGGGVAGAIRNKGGPTIQEECNRIGGTFVGGAEVTGAGNLKASYVIHAVGPVWGEGDEDHKLTAAVTGSLKLADRLELASLAFPAISTGIYGFPKERAAGLIYAAVREYFNQHPDSGLNLVRLTLYDQPTVAAFLQVWDQAQGGT